MLGGSATLLGSPWRERSFYVFPGACPLVLLAPRSNKVPVLWHRYRSRYSRIGQQITAFSKHLEFPFRILLFHFPYLFKFFLLHLLQRKLVGFKTCVLTVTIIDWVARASSLYAGTVTEYLAPLIASRQSPGERARTRLRGFITKKTTRQERYRVLRTFLLPASQIPQRFTSSSLHLLIAAHRVLLPITTTSDSNLVPFLQLHTLPHTHHLLSKCRMQTITSSFFLHRPTSAPSRLRTLWTTRPHRLALPSRSDITSTRRHSRLPQFLT